MRSLLLLAATGLLALAVGAAAQTPVTVSFDPPEGIFNCGETLLVDLVVDAAAADLRGFSLELTYDPAVIEPVAVNAGALLVGAACDHFFTWLNPGTPGMIAVDGAALGCSVAGPGAIVTIEFAGLVDGTSPLACLSGILRDGDNAPIDYTCEPGTVTYSCPVATSPVSWGALRSWYR